MNVIYEREKLENNIGLASSASILQNPNTHLFVTCNKIESSPFPTFTILCESKDLFHLLIYLTLRKH